MSKNNKVSKENAKPNYIVFLVEGDSDTIALESPLSELIFEKHPDYEVRFLLQERLVNQQAEELDDPDENDEEDNDSLLLDAEYQRGGDITSSAFVTPGNIENKIYRRFILPETRRFGLYPKRIAKIIQIVDLDGAYIPEEFIVDYSKDNLGREKLFYDDNNKQIQCSNPSVIAIRNAQKRANINHLLSLPEGKIKIKSKKIPYEIYFFSSNLDHFLYHNANVEYGKKKLASDFVRKYGMDLKSFQSFFQNDEAAIGSLGYWESWDKVRESSNSISRFTNIDYLINSLLTD